MKYRLLVQIFLRQFCVVLTFVYDEYFMVKDCDVCDHIKFKFLLQLLLLMPPPLLLFNSSPCLIGLVFQSYWRWSQFFLKHTWNRCCFCHPTNSVKGTNNRLCHCCLLSASNMSSILLVNIHCESKKPSHYTFVCNFIKC